MSSSLNGLLRSNSSGSSHTPSFATAFSAQNSSIASEAKLQNTPQLIYMCREALKIEA